MRIEYRYINFNKTQNEHKKIIKILDNYSIKYNYKNDINCVLDGFQYYLEFKLYDNNTSLKEIQKKLKPFNLFVDINTLYSSEELNNAKYFRINVGQYQYPQPEDNFNYLDKTFDLKYYCSICGIGKIQNNPFRLKKEPKQKNNQFWGLHWEFDSVFVREEAKNIFKRENIQGIDFIPVILNKNNKQIDRFYQLKIETVLDNGFNPYNTIKITCKFNNEENTNKNNNEKYCGKIKYHHPRIGGHLFDKKIFFEGIDIFMSNEYFGSGGEAHKLIIVSKKTYEIINKNKLKGIEFTPIMHEEYKNDPNCT